jgi:hypothetical protein
MCWSSMGVSQNPHLEIRTWPSPRLNHGAQAAPILTCNLLVCEVRSELPCWRPPMQSGPSLMSGLATCQSSIISVVGRSGELELGWRSRSSGEGWAGSSCRRGSRRFSPPGSHQFQWRAASWPPGPARSGPGWRPGAWPQPGRPISLNETGRLDRECAEHGDRSMAATRDPHPTRTRLAGA